MPSRVLLCVSSIFLHIIQRGSNRGAFFDFEEVAGIISGWRTEGKQILMPMIPMSINSFPPITHFTKN